MSWCRGVVVSWCRGVGVSWCSGVVVLWCCGVVVLWCCGVVVLWCSGAAVQRCSGATVQCWVMVLQPDDNQLVVGMADGLLSAQRRRKTQQAEGRKEGARRVRSAAQVGHSAAG